MKLAELCCVSIEWTFVCYFCRDVLRYKLYEHERICMYQPRRSPIHVVCTFHRFTLRPSFLCVIHRERIECEEKKAELEAAARAKKLAELRAREAALKQSELLSEDHSASEPTVRGQLVVFFFCLSRETVRLAKTGQKSLLCIE